MTHKISLFLIGPALVTLVFLFADKITTSIFEEHNWMRLQRTFIWSRGYPIYPNFETGPIITSIYGPISAVVYWPTTLLPFLHAVPAGVFCSILFFFTPASILILKGRFAKAKPLSLSLLSVSCFILMAALLSSTKRSAFIIHADAPALGFGACACAFIYWKRSFRNETLPLWLSALFAVTAVWTKQTAIPLLIALPLFVLWADGAKSFFKYLAALFVIMVFFLFLFAASFDLRDMFDSMIRMPSRHPMKSEGWQTIVKAVIRILRENLLLLAVSLPATWHLFRRPKKSWRAWANAYRWILFWLVAMCMAPLALMASIKIGGSNNTLSFVSYFSLTGTLLAFTELFRPLRKNCLHRFAAKALLFYAALLLVITVPLIFYRIVNSKKEVFFVKDAYEYALRYPDTAYFPRFTIVNLAAEGKVYHETEGVNDRVWAGMPIDKKRFNAYVPKNLKVIGFRGEDHRKSLPFERFKYKDTNYPELPGFIVYTEKPDHSSAG